jgi:hypothetical protein
MDHDLDAGEGLASQVADNHLAAKIRPLTEYSSNVNAPGTFTANTHISLWDALASIQHAN